MFRSPAKDCRHYRRGCRNTRPPKESRRAGEPQRESRRAALEESRQESNKAQKDLFNYDLDKDGYGIRLNEEWANKGLNWLKSLIKKNGEPKAGQSLGYREVEIIKTAQALDFTFVCFYDNGRGWYRNFVPVYNVAGMEYRVEAGKIIVTA